ncbi:hypothetical protein D3C81_1187170 [compost metagenome]
MGSVGDFGQHRQSLAVTADHDAPARRFRNDKHQHQEQHARDHFRPYHPAPAHLHQPGFAGDAGDFEVNVENHNLAEHDGELLHAERSTTHVFR